VQQISLSDFLTPRVDIEVVSNETAKKPDLFTPEEIKSASCNFLKPCLGERQ
jgi:hypothetical protein